MELWLIRHVDAGDPVLDGDDGARAPTEEGRAQARVLERALERLGVEFDVLLHSPLLRAIETGEALVPRLAPRGTTRTSAHLAEAPSLSLLEELVDVRRAAVVGHEPWLGALAFWLATGWSSSAPEKQPTWVRLEKGGALRLSGEPAPGRMRVEALFDRRALRRTARRR